MRRLLTYGDPIFSVPSRATPATTTRRATAMSQGGKVYSYTISTIPKKHLFGPSALSLL